MQISSVSPLETTSPQIMTVVTETISRCDVTLKRYYERNLTCASIDLMRDVSCLLRNLSLHKTFNQFTEQPYVLKNYSNTIRLQQDWFEIEKLFYIYLKKLHTLKTCLYDF